jgi:hypothetical protein
MAVSMDRRTDSRVVGDWRMREMVAPGPVVQ